MPARQGALRETKYKVESGYAVVTAFGRSFAHLFVYPVHKGCSADPAAVWRVHRVHRSKLRQVLYRVSGLDSGEEHIFRFEPYGLYTAEAAVILVTGERQQLGTARVRIRKAHSGYHSEGVLFKGNRILFGQFFKKAVLHKVKVESIKRIVLHVFAATLLENKRQGQER